MRDLPRRLIVLEAKAGQPGERVCLFVMPGEDAAAALARTFGPAGAPLGATVTLFSWLPVQGSIHREVCLTIPPQEPAA